MRYLAPDVYSLRQVTARVSSANALPSASASASPPLVGRAFSDSAVTEPKEPPPERERRGPSPLAAGAWTTEIARDQCCSLCCVIFA